MQHSITRSLIIAFIGLCLYSVAAGQPAATSLSSPFFPFYSPAARDIMPILTYSGAYANGRALSQVEGGADFGLTNRFSLGACWLDSSGHGHSAQNTYKGDGQHYWANYRLLTLGSAGPQLGLLLDHTHDAVTLHYQTDSTFADAWPHYNTTGTQLTGQWPHGAVCYQGRAGIYGVDTYSSYLATVALLGGGVNANLSRKTSATLQVTGYQNRYDNGSQWNYELFAGVSYAPGKTSAISLSGSLFPRGVPMAATPFSSAAAAGLTFDGSVANSFRTEAIGYLTLSGHLSF